MRYSNLKIQDFRGIKACNIQDLSRVNIFLGQNNSGKSSILEAIFLLTGFSSPLLVLSINIFRQLSHTEEDDFRFIFYNLDYSSKILIESDLFEKGSHRRLEISPKNNDSTKKINVQNKQLVSSGTATTDSINNDNSIFVSDNENLASEINSLQFKAEIKQFHEEKKVFISSLISQRNGGQIEFSVESPQKSINSFKALLQGVNYSNLNELGKGVDRLIVSKLKPELIENLKQIEHRITDISTSSNAMIYVDIGAKKMIPSNLMGDGFLKFLNVIANINEVRDGIMLIDEIDNGLHFTTLKKLWKIILNAAKRFNTQLFITTHSKEALFHLKEVLEEESMNDYQSSIRCYTISKLEGNIVKAYKYDFSSMEYALENDIEIRGEI